MAKKKNPAAGPTSHEEAAEWLFRSRLGRTGTETLPDKAYVKAHVAVIHKYGRLTALQEKVAFILLFHAYHELADESVLVHKINLRYLAKLLGWKAREPIAKLRATVERLAETTVRWNLHNEEGRREWGVTAWLAGARHVEGAAAMEYSYSPFMRKMLFQPEVYSKVLLGVLNNLKGRYDIALYLNCKRFEGKGWTPAWTVSKWKNLLAVPSSAYYAEFKNFNRKILLPAIEAVNEDTDINIAIHSVRNGKRGQKLQFRVTRMRPLPERSRSVPTRVSVPAMAEDDVTVRMRQVGLTDPQIRKLRERHSDKHIHRNLDVVAEKVAAGKCNTVPAFAYQAICHNYADYLSDAGVPDLTADEKQHAMRVMARVRQYPIEWQKGVCEAVKTTLQESGDEDAVDMFELERHRGITELEYMNARVLRAWVPHIEAHLARVDKQ